MTEAQIEVLRALADNGMSVPAAAKAMGKKPATLHVHINNIMSSTGKDPLCFRELNELLKMAKRQQGKKRVFVCTCKVCGAKFDAPDHHFRLCGDKCRAIAKAKTAANQAENRAAYMRGYRESMAEYEKKYDPKTTTPSMSLSEASRRAREMGMTYGQYMTYLKERA